MLQRIACSVGVAAVLALAALRPSSAQSPAPTAPSSGVAEPAAASKVRGAPAQTIAAPSEVFGADINLAARPIVYLKSAGTWDKAFGAIVAALRTVKAFVDKEGLMQDGPAMAIFTLTDDVGFHFEAAIPVAALSKNPPAGEIAVGTSPQGHALKFVHRGSYDALDDAYEAVTNYLDEKGLEAKDMFIEQYVTDPLTANKDSLVINILVPIK